MEIKITFDDENNEFADITLDGQTVRATRSRMDATHTQEDSAGREILSQLFDAVPNILKIREIQGRRGTWEKLDESELEVIEDEVW